jgi:hypothetical protein
MKANLKRIDDFLHEHEQAIRTAFNATSMFLCTGKAELETPNSKSIKDLSRNVNNGAPHFVFNTSPAMIQPEFHSVKCSTCYSNGAKDPDGTQYFEFSFHKEDFLEWTRVDYWMFFNKKLLDDFVTIEADPNMKAKLMSEYKKQYPTKSDYFGLKLPFSSVRRHHVSGKELWSYKCPKWVPEDKADMKVRQLDPERYFGDCHVATGKKLSRLAVKGADGKIRTMTIAKLVDTVQKRRKEEGFKNTAADLSLKKKFYARKDVLVDDIRRFRWNIFENQYEVVSNATTVSKSIPSLIGPVTVGLPSNKDKYRRKNRK